MNFEKAQRSRIFEKAILPRTLFEAVKQQEVHGVSVNVYKILLCL